MAGKQRQVKRVSQSEHSKRLSLLQAIILLHRHFEDVSQNKLAMDLGIDPAELNKKWKRLQSEGICRVTATMNIDEAIKSLGYTSEEYQNARLLCRDKELENQLKTCLRLKSYKQSVDLVVVKSWGETDVDVIQRQVAYAAADYIHHILQYWYAHKGICIGVSYGYSVHLLIHQLAEMLKEKPIQSGIDATVFNMNGSIVSPIKSAGVSTRAAAADRTLRSSSLEHARVLADALNAHRLEYWGPGFIPLSATYPKSDHAKELSLFRDEILRRYDPQQLFQGECHEQDADLLITGIGSKLSFTAILDATNRLSPSIRKYLDDHAEGDISGVVLSDGVQSPELRLLESSTIGVGRKIFEQLVGKRQGQLGVLALASGPEKANCVVAALRSGLISILVIDEELAKQVANSLDPPSNKKSPRQNPSRSLASGH